MNPYIAPKARGLGRCARCGCRCCIESLGRCVVQVGQKVCSVDSAIKNRSTTSTDSGLNNESALRRPWDSGTRCIQTQLPKSTEARASIKPEVDAVNRPMRGRNGRCIPTVHRIFFRSALRSKSTAAFDGESAG
jgi:hypothetical protein